MKMIKICHNINLLGACPPRSSFENDPIKTPRFTPAYKYNIYNSNRVSEARPNPGKCIIQIIRC